MSWFRVCSYSFYNRIRLKWKPSNNDSRSSPRESFYHLKRLVDISSAASAKMYLKTPFAPSVGIFSPIQTYFLLHLHRKLGINKQSLSPMQAFHPQATSIKRPHRSKHGGWFTCEVHAPSLHVAGHVLPCEEASAVVRIQTEANDLVRFWRSCGSGNRNQRWVFQCSDRHC